jgi:hypothetical protein
VVRNAWLNGIQLKLTLVKIKKAHQCLKVCICYSCFQNINVVDIIILGNPYPLPEVSSKLIQYLKSLPFEEIDADLLPLLEHSSNSSSGSLGTTKQRSSIFFLSDTSSQSDATFSQYHDALVWVLHFL